jgi:hypothetical protein
MVRINFGKYRFGMIDPYRLPALGDDFTPTGYNDRTTG